jgi:DNA invertase Pin-like site-specific DNA recombinase
MVKWDGMVAAYVRVSTKSQDGATQLASIERAAKARGDTLLSVYSEKRSGKTIVRPELDRLRADARGGLISRLYVFRLDRLTRSGIKDTFELVEEFKRYGVELVSIADGFDLGGAAAEVVLAVMAWAAKIERVAINERISAARERVEAEGRHWGREPVKIDLERARALKSSGKSIRQIAMALKVSKSTLARALSHKVTRKVAS